MNKLIALLLAATLLIGFVGCSVPNEVSPVEPILPIDEPVDTEPEPEPEQDALPTDPSSAFDPVIEARLIDQTWISPAMVQIGNFYPGATASWNLRVHNGKDTVARFVVGYREPDYVKEGFDKPPLGAQDWVIVADPTPVFAPKQTKEITITLAIPQDAVVKSPRWEFWVSVSEVSGDMVVVEMVSRWLVVHRQEA